MKTFKQFILESCKSRTIKDLENKLKETSDTDMREVILRKIQQAKLSNK